MYFRPLPVLTASTSIAFLILMALGLWQLERRAEKHALLHDIAQRMIAPAESIEGLLIDESQAPFRHATAQGTFEHAQEAYVFAPRSDDSGTHLGYKVITPLRLTASAVVFVDRGWVPQERRAPGTRLKGQPDGPVTIRGLLKTTTTPGLFTPEPDLAQRVWYLHDIAAMAAAFALKPATVLYLEASMATPGGPEPIAELPEIPDNHLQYALTWFALAVVLVIVYLVFHHSRGRLRFRR